MPARHARGVEASVGAAVGGAAVGGASVGRASVGGAAHLSAAHQPCLPGCRGAVHPEDDDAPDPDELDPDDDAPAVLLRCSAMSSRMSCAPTSLASSSRDCKPDAFSSTDTLSYVYTIPNIRG